MTLKTRFVTTISMFFLVVALLITGVWAASSANVNIGGTISFNATNIYATITGSISGASTTPTLSPLNYSAKSNPGATELNTWKQNLTFADATTPTIKWTVTIENKSERALYVTLTDNIANLANATKTLTFDNGSASGEKTIPAKASKVYTMEIKVTDTNASVSVDYDFNFDLRDASASQNQGGGNSSSSVDLKWDSTNNYWYVTMGSTDTLNEIKWRLVGVDGERYTSTTKPSAGTVGTFILETNTSINHVYDETNFSNEYATSDIRTYLNGDYITKLNLANDAIYQSITARQISDLYTNMAWREDDNYQVEDISLPSGATGADKLWLMSVAEIYTLVGGGTITDSTINGDWSTYYDNLIWNELYYWLRSPDPGDSSRVFRVYGNGGWGFHRVDVTGAVRPAFNLEF